MLNNFRITIWVNYLVNWVWIGTAVMLIGGLISLGLFEPRNRGKR